MKYKIDTEIDTPKTIKKFKQKMNTEGRSYKWFHKEYLNGITYPYFIIQLNEPDRVSDQVKDAISNFIDGV